MSTNQRKRQCCSVWHWV